MKRLRSYLGRDWALAWLLIAPTAIALVSLLAYPFLDALLLSFQRRFIGKPGAWIGLQNYVDFFTDQNNHFLQAAAATLLITAGAIAGKLLLGLAMASVLNQKIIFRDFWRGLMLLPWAVPGVVAAYVWRFLFDINGPLNTVAFDSGIMDDFIYFFNDPELAVPALILVLIWTGLPFWTMNFLAGMQSISETLYEAATIDGAGRFKRFLYVTLPGLRPVILVTVLLSTIWTSANINIIFVLTGGGPNYATTTLPFLSYKVAILGKQLGAGAAISMMMMPFYLSLVYFLTKRMLEEE